MSYLEQMNTKRQATAQTNKEQSELSAMLAEMKKIQMMTSMSSSKPSVVLTDQTDLGDKIKELTTKLTGALKETDTTNLSKHQLLSLKALEKGLQSLEKAVSNKTHDNSEVVRAIKAIDLKPIVNLPAPIVNVEAKDIDFSPLQDTIKEYFKHPDTKIDLDCYRAQDIKEDGDTQYVGFVNPDGNWYIIENKTRDNSLRYVFGSGNYAKAFKKAAQYNYSLLNEAINAISA